MICTLLAVFYILLSIGDVFSRDVDVKVGDQIKLCCQLTYEKENGIGIFHKGYKLKIYFNDKLRDADMNQFKQNNPDFNVELVDSSLCMLKPAAAVTDDKFEVTCKVQKEGMFETLQEETINLRVYEQLQFTEEPASFLNVSVGETKSVECSATGSPDLQVFWRNEKSGKISSGTSSAILKLDDITMDQNMQSYVCEASTSIPKNNVITKTMTIQIMFKPEITIDMAVVHTDMGNNEDIKITVKGYPQPKLVCDLLNIPNDRLASISSPDPSVYVYKLTILDISEKDIKNSYTCRAENSQGTDIKNIQLKILPSGLKITSPNSTSFSDYYLLSWVVNSKSSLTSLNITVEIEEDGNWSIQRSELVKDDQVVSHQKSMGSPENNWEKSFQFHLYNLTNDRQFRVLLNVCNKHGCIDSVAPASFKTQIFDGKNKYDPSSQFLNSNSEGKSAITSVEFKPTLLVLITQSLVVLLLPLMLQQIN